MHYFIYTEPFSPSYDKCVEQLSQYVVDIEKLG